MKTTTTTIIALSIAIPLLSLSAEEPVVSPTTPQVAEQVEALKKEIERQELILRALNDRLSAIEEVPTKEGEFIINLVGGEPTLMGSKISFEEIELAFNRRAKISSSYPIIIRADESTQYSSVMEVLNLAQKAGLFNIAFAKGKK
jgi:CMP-2-keto-3-deoxyoctulosonic acid synthetase